jgi:hypothetical protein
MVVVFMRVRSHGFMW